MENPLDALQAQLQTQATQAGQSAAQGALTQLNAAIPGLVNQVNAAIPDLVNQATAQLQAQIPALQDQIRQAGKEAGKGAREGVFSDLGNKEVGLLIGGAVALLGAVGLIAYTASRPSAGAMNALRSFEPFDESKGEHSGFDVHEYLHWNDGGKQHKGSKAEQLDLIQSIATWGQLPVEELSVAQRAIVESALMRPYVEHVSGSRGDSIAPHPATR